MWQFLFGLLLTLTGGCVWGKQESGRMRHCAGLSCTCVFNPSRRSHYLLITLKPPAARFMTGSYKFSLVFHLHRDPVVKTCEKRSLKPPHLAEKKLKMAKCPRQCLEELYHACVYKVVSISLNIGFHEQADCVPSLIFLLQQCRPWTAWVSAITTAAASPRCIRSLESYSSPS